MAKIFVTGSADGLGQLAAKELVFLGHQVVLHARSETRAIEARRGVPGAQGALVGDLSSIKQTIQLAASANEFGHFDAVIHNAGVYQVSASQLSEDGFPMLLAVNVFAPYILTCLMHKPRRMIYLSSGMHLQGDPTLKELHGNKPRISYSDSKLYDLILAKAVARKWSDTFSNAVDPGWVPTKMGGANAPDNLQKGYETQVWLALGEDSKANVSGCYFHHKKQDQYVMESCDAEVQEVLLTFCQKATGVSFPEESNL